MDTDASAPRTDGEPPETLPPDRRRNAGLYITAVLAPLIVALVLIGVLPKTLDARTVNDFLSAIDEGARTASTSKLIDYLAVALIGALVGATEIIARYRDSPRTALSNAPAWIYIAVNASASILALALTHLFAWNFFAPEGATSEQVRWVRIISAGFGAMLILRSSFFVSRGIGDNDEEMNFGPSSVLKVVLDAADRAIDRKQAKRRAYQVVEYMKEVDYTRAELALPTHVLALLQGFSEAEQLLIRKEIEALASTPDRGKGGIAPDIKSLILGLKIMGFAGPDVLKEAVDTLDHLIKKPKPQPAPDLAHPDPPPGSDSASVTAPDDTPTQNTDPSQTLDETPAETEGAGLTSDETPPETEGAGLAPEETPTATEGSDPALDEPLTETEGSGPVPEETSAREEDSGSGPNN